MPRPQCRLILSLSLLMMTLAISAKPILTQEPGMERFTLTVTDQTGTVIPGATIEVDAKPCFPESDHITNASGEVLLELAAGSHSLSIAVDGFVPLTQPVNVKTGNNLPVQIILRVGLPTSVNVSVATDLILLNGTILTGECLAEGLPQIISAMAITNGKVQAIGTDAQIKALATTNTKIRDLNGAFVMPGLNDAHLHLQGAAETKLNVNLTGSKSLAEMLTRIQTKAQQSPAGHWLTGGGWDHTLWPKNPTGQTLPTRQDLDKVTSNHPTLLERIDGHIAIANSAALKLANITAQSQAPKGGAIDLDPQGQPTGILRDTAMEQVEKIVPPPTPEERKIGLKLVLNDAIAHGLTSVQDNSDWETFLVFEDLEKEGNLKVRISEWLPFDADIETLKAHRTHHNLADPMLHTGMLKGFMDGSLGSRTAALKAPYTDDPTNSGLARYDQTKLNAMVVERSTAGFQIGFHAIGDQAASMALNAFSQPIKMDAPSFPPSGKGGTGTAVSDKTATVSSNRRNRIEHAQVVDPADIPRFKQLGVIASMQPNHLLTDMNWAEARLGPQRAAYSYAWKTFLDAQVPLAFGTDYPVEPVTPFRGLYAAVTRMNEAGTKTYFPENKLTRTQALYAYTQGSAYAEFEEKTKGKLTPGYDADFILLDTNLLTCTAPEILKTKVLQTALAGKTVYSSESKPGGMPETKAAQNPQN